MDSSTTNLKFLSQIEFLDPYDPTDVIIDDFSQNT